MFAGSCPRHGATQVCLGHVLQGPFLAPLEALGALGCVGWLAGDGRRVRVGHVLLSLNIYHRQWRLGYPGLDLKTQKTYI